MKTFDLFNRRTHLYLGLLLLPWLLMYGVSSFMISHQEWFKNENPPNWKLVSEKEYSRPVPENADLRDVAHEILRDFDMEGAFWAQRPRPNEIRINRFRFRDESRVTYLIKEQKLRIEHQAHSWNRVILRLHFRGGFIQPTFWNDFWAVIVDFICLAMLAWVFSGFLMWWKQPRLRGWGAFALVAGLFSFLAFIWRL